MKPFVLFLCLICFLSCFSKREENIEDKLLKATCKIELEYQDPKTGKEGSASGTGVIIDETPQSYIILTAGHVAQISPHPYVIFSDKNKMPGKVIFCCWEPNIPSEDMALIEVQKKWFQFKPRVIPLGYEYSDDLYTLGCAQGEHPSLIKTTLKNRELETFTLNFQTLKGRSGSPVVDKDCKNVLGIIVQIETDALLKDYGIIRILDSSVCVNSEIMIHHIVECIDYPGKKYILENGVYKYQILFFGQSILTSLLFGFNDGQEFL